MELKYVQVEKENGLATIWMNKPPANTYDYVLMREIDQAVEDIRFDDKAKVVIISSKIEKFFSAGADIKLLNESTPDYKSAFCLYCQETVNKFENTPKIFIAAINGHCVGGGLEIALACDLRFMAKDSGRIGFAEVNLGLLPGTGGTQRLARLIGKPKALDLIITGRTLMPEEAYQIGLIDRVFDREKFWDESRAYAKNLTQGAVKSIGLIKVAIQHGLEAPVHAGLALERELQNRLFISEDAAEGIRAFLDKRKPVFKGR